ncbi:MAG: hypothetical protein Q9197_007027, partial [Variospora fuerteventurae]
ARSLPQQNPRSRLQASQSQPDTAQSRQQPPSTPSSRFQPQHPDPQTQPQHRLSQKRSSNPYRPPPADAALPPPTSVDGPAGEDGDWESSFSRRYPTLAGLEMVETEIDGRSSQSQMHSSLTSPPPVRVKDV